MSDIRKGFSVFSEFIILKHIDHLTVMFLLFACVIELFNFNKHNKPVFKAQQLDLWGKCFYLK